MDIVHMILAGSAGVYLCGESFVPEGPDTRLRIVASTFVPGWPPAKAHNCPRCLVAATEMVPPRDAPKTASLAHMFNRAATSAEMDAMRVDPRTGKRD